ncbi:MAG: rod-binding protein [Spirochaetaceae bacterium]|jgi:flagellar protein FlgJ|nr:rod-binding protein [Spirochaetaceae bacterium]
MEVSSLLQVYTAGAAPPLAGRSPTGISGASFADASFAQTLEQTVAASGGAADGRRPVIDKNSKLYEQCFELETFLLKILVKGMRSTVQKTNLIDTGFAGEIYEDMLYDEYTRDLTRNARLGLADTAYLELTGQRGRLMEHYA